MEALRLTSPCAQLPQSIPAFIDWGKSGQRDSIQFYRATGAYLVRFSGLVDFVVDDTGAQATASPVPGICRDTVDYLYSNWIKPLQLSRQGEFVLHGSAVSSSDGALLFLAASGAGKSTLATYLSSVGYPLLSDDSVVLSQQEFGAVVEPAYPAVRLWGESLDALDLRSLSQQPGGAYTSKYQVPVGTRLRYCSEGRPLAAIYLLGSGAASKSVLQPVRGSEALAKMLQFSFFLADRERSRVAQHFQRAGLLLGDIPVYELNYPRSYEQLPAVAALLPAVS